MPEQEPLEPNIDPADLQGDPDEFVHFGTISIKYLKRQAQYGSEYVNGGNGRRPNLGEGLSFLGGPGDYHTLKIRRGDIPEFVRRVQEYQHQMGCGPEDIKSWDEDITKESEPDLQLPTLLQQAPRDPRVFGDETILELLENRHINHEDLDIIAAMAHVNKNILIERYHNTLSFLFHSGRNESEEAITRIEGMMTAAKKDLEKARIAGDATRELTCSQGLVLDEAVLQLVKTYDIYVAHAVIRRLEKW